MRCACGRVGVVVGETRGAETWDMLRAIDTPATVGAYPASTPTAREMRSTPLSRSG